MVKSVSNKFAQPRMTSSKSLFCVASVQNIQFTITENRKKQQINTFDLNFKFKLVTVWLHQLASKLLYYHYYYFLFICLFIFYTMRTLLLNLRTLCAPSAS